MPDESEKNYPQVVHVMAEPYTNKIFTVIINRGVSSVQIGQEFLIFGLGEELIDPQTRQSLGKLELVRGKGRVAYVQEKVAHVKCIERRPSTRKTTRSAMGLMGGEVIEEPGEELPFDNPSVGDFAKLVK